MRHQNKHKKVRIPSEWCMNIFHQTEISTVCSSFIFRKYRNRNTPLIDLITNTQISYILHFANRDKCTLATLKTIRKYKAICKESYQRVMEGTNTTNANTLLATMSHRTGEQLCTRRPIAATLHSRFHPNTQIYAPLCVIITAQRLAPHR